MGRNDAGSFAKGIIVMLFGIFLAYFINFLYEAGNTVITEIIDTTTITVPDLMFFIFFIFVVIGILIIFLD